MEGGSRPENTGPEAVPRRIPPVPMHIAGGNSSLADAQVVFVGTDNHYDSGFQSRIATTLNILPQAGDVVLTEGEPFGGSMSASWVPEMARVDTSKVTMSGWEDSGLYNQATGIVDSLTRDVQIYNGLISSGLAQFALPLIDRLKRGIDTARKKFDTVVLHKRSSAMKRAAMSMLGSRLKEGGTVFVYAGSAHLTKSELSGMGGVKHVVLGV